MRQFLGAVLAAGLVFYVSPQLRADDDAKDIIKKAIESCGGAEKIDKLKGAKTNAKGKLNFGGFEVELAIESVSMYPDKIKSTMKMELMGMAVTAVQKVIGDKATVTSNGMNVDLPEAAKEQMSQMVVLESVQRLTPLLTDSEFKLKSLGASKIDGKDVNGVEVGGKGLKELRLFFEKSSGLLIQMERKGFDPIAMKEAKMVVVLSDYKDVSGVKKSWKSVIMSDGQKHLETTITDLKLLEKIDDKEFSD